MRRKGTVKRMKKTLKALNALKGISADQSQQERQLTLAEYELEDKCRPVNPNLKDGRVLYYHLAGAVIIRKELFFTICENMQEQSQKQALADQETGGDGATGTRAAGPGGPRSSSRQQLSSSRRPRTRPTPRS